MLVEKLNLAIVDSLGDFFSDLVRTPPFNHVQARPAVFRLCAGRSSHEEVILELSFQFVLLDMVR
jgi:hypothetical protein